MKIFPIKISIIAAFLLFQTMAQAKVLLFSEKEQGSDTPAVQIKIEGNSGICMSSAKKCLDNAIWFGTKEKSQDSFNFDIYNPVKQTFKEFDTIAWTEIDNETGSETQCSATISPKLSRGDDEGVKLIFGKGCTLRVENPDRMVSITSKQQTKAGKKPGGATESSQSPANLKLLDATGDHSLARVNQALQEGADVNIEIEGYRDKTALGRAAFSGYDDIVERLLREPNIDVNKISGGNQSTPLIYAVIGYGGINPIGKDIVERKKIIDLLLNNKADLEKKAALGYPGENLGISKLRGTALVHALLAERLDLFEYLLQKGAQPNVMDYYKRRWINLILLLINGTPIENEVLNILKKYGWTKDNGQFIKQ